MKSIEKFLITSVFFSILSFVPSAYAGDEDRKEEAQNLLGGAEGCLAQGAAEQKGENFIPDCFLCSVCLDVYDEAHRYPLGLMCGHSYCAPCLTQIPKRREGRWDLVKCPNCRQELPAPIGKNFGLLGSLREYNKQNLNKPAPQKPACIGQNGLSDQARQIGQALCDLYQLYNKQGLSWRRHCDPASALAEFNNAFKLAISFTFADKKEKEYGWLFAQIGFLLSDLEQHEGAARYLEMALEKYEAHLSSQIAKGTDQKILALIQKDIETVKVHLLKEKLRNQSMDKNEAKAEFDRLSHDFIAKKWNGNRSMGQLTIGKAICFHEEGDLENALIHSKEAIDFLNGEDGAQICTWTQIHVLADKVEMGGGVPSVELLKSNDALQWRKQFEDERKRAIGAGDMADMGHVLFNLGRLARSFGLIKQAHDFMTRAIKVAMETEAMFHARADEFRDLPIPFEFKLPKWFDLAKAALAELEAKHDLGDIQVAQPEVEQFFEGI